MSASAKCAIASYRQGRIELKTDLSESEARALLKRLNATLCMISKYWNRPLQRNVTFFVVDHLDNWPAESLQNPQARMLLRNIKGGTQIVVKNNRYSKRIAHVYATSELGVAEHELVHAYCELVFGGSGPDWYQEGMAEMASNHSRHQNEIQRSRDVVDELRRHRDHSVNGIVKAGEFTKPITATFSRKEIDLSGGIPVSWQSSDDAILSKARIAYNRSWSFCHFLCNNNNYSARFRLAGKRYLQGSKGDFNQLFGSIQEQLDFEYGQFMRHIQNGYRVDLCRWDWSMEFGQIESQRAKSVVVKAQRGFQPTGLRLEEGKQYRFETSGTWTTTVGGDAMTSNGDKAGVGRLVAVALNGFKLSEPFLLGEQGEFTASQNGNLYVRCHDEWNSIADNQGQITLTLKASATSSKLTASALPEKSARANASVAR